MKRTKLQVYEDALLNIMFRYGKCWTREGRELKDPQEVAHRAIKKANPELYKKLGPVKYPEVKVYKNGRVKINYG